MSVILHADRWAPSKRRRLEAHRNPGLEIVHVVAGRTRWKIGDRAFDLRPGDVYYTLPWEVHGGAAAREPGLVLDFAILALKRRYARPRDRFEFHPSLGLSARQSARLSRVLVERRDRAFPAGDRLPWLLGQLVELGGGGASEPMLATSMTVATIAELARIARTAPKCRRGAGGADGGAARRVAAFLGDLPRACDRPWSLASMAAACGVGRTRFGQLVRQQTGDTPILALNRARVQRAERLLRQTDQPITRIAHDCGFSSSQYFARLFKEYTGESASEYRRINAK